MASTTTSLGVNTYGLHPLSSLSAWGVEPGKGVVRSRVSRTGQAGAPIAGAEVTVASYLHPSNPPVVSYPESGTGATEAAGRYMIVNAEEGDLLTVSATKEGWEFKQRTFLVHRDGVLEGRVWGTPAESRNGVLSVSPAVLDFGRVGIGMSSQQVKVTYRNTGGGPVTIVSATGSVPDVHRVSSTCSGSFPLTLAAGAGCTVTYVFTPTEAGDRGGAVTLATDSVVTPTVTETYLAEGYLVPPPQLSLRAATGSFKGTGGSGTINFAVTGTGNQLLHWLAETEASWISIPFPAGTVSLNKGKASGSFRFSVSPNPSAIARTATITIGDAEFTVNQAGASCRIGKIEPGSLVIGPESLSTALLLSLPEDCPIEIAEQSPWVAAAATGANVYVTIDANTTGKSRTAKLKITTGTASRTFTISQKK